MEPTIAKEIERESNQYNIGRTHVKKLLERIVINGIKLEMTNKTIISNLKKVGEITRNSNNPFLTLTRITEAHELTNDRRIAQEIIGLLYLTYLSNTNNDGKLFEDNQIKESINILTNNYRD
jgi:hypothetical protein